MRIAVRGRRGVGVSTVADALAGNGLQVVDDAAGAEVAVLVITEVAKPEDLAELTGLQDAGLPVLMVLNKADLAGSGPGGPVATAHRRATQLRALTGVPVEPMVALLVTAAPTAQQLSALRILTAEPGDLTSPDAFLTTSHRLPVDARADLLGTFDRFGIAHAVLELSRGADASAVMARLRNLGGVDRVVAALDVVAAPVRYRRVRRALAQLRAIGDDRIGRFVAADDTVIAVMATAVDVVQASGLVVERGHDTDAHLRRARYWRRYSRGPVNALHRSCGADIARGSLRLLGGVLR